MIRSGDAIRIHYGRPPDREHVFVQQLVAQESGCVITLLEKAPITEALRIDGSTALEPGAPAVWFTFPGEWHDIGRFHNATGEFTGIYANILTPVEGLESRSWRTTDLFLDIWLPAAGGGVLLLDADELDAAVAAGHVSVADGQRARREADRLLRRHARGEWPPSLVHEWTLDRARAVDGT